MKTTFVTVLAASLLFVTSAAPASDDGDRSIYLSRRTVATGAQIMIFVPDACTVCNYFGLACVAACVAGGPLDPLCDVCAGPAIGTCLDCLASNITKV